jgi:hypothetical protein
LFEDIEEALRLRTRKFSNIGRNLKSEDFYPAFLKAVIVYTL